MESFPPDTWTESGQTPALTESSSSRECVTRERPDLPQIAHMPMSVRLHAYRGVHIAGAPALTGTMSKVGSSLTLIAGLVSVALFAPVVAAFVAESDFNPLYPLLGFTLAAMVLGRARHFLRANPYGMSHAMVTAGIMAAAATLGMCLLLLVAAMPLLITGGA
jgi:hypothetical protein